MLNAVRLTPFYILTRGIEFYSLKVFAFETLT